MGAIRAQVEHHGYEVKYFWNLWTVQVSKKLGAGEQEAGAAKRWERWTDACTITETYALDWKTRILQKFGIDPQEVVTNGRK